MALTLPYPNLSFVPLDVLTAEEMNQIVANYTAIANAFPLATTNIADGSVTSDKVDWTTIQKSIALTPVVDSGNITVSVDSAQVFGNVLFLTVTQKLTSSITVPANGSNDTGRFHFQEVNLTNGCIGQGLTGGRPVFTYCNSGTSWNIGTRIFANSSSAQNISSGTYFAINIIALLPNS